MVNNRTSLDPRWSGHHTEVAAGFMTADIRVIRKSPTANLAYDQETRTYIGAFTTIFTGKARVQPYGIIGDELLAQDPTGKRLMRVQIREKLTGINLDDFLQVTLCENNPELESFAFSVRGTIGSNVSWLTDLVCEANLKRNLEKITTAVTYPSGSTYPPVIPR